MSGVNPFSSIAGGGLRNVRPLIPSTVSSLPINLGSLTVGIGALRL